MPDLVIHPTSTAQWHALVNEAQSACDCMLPETLESYLVFLLMRFADKPHMLARVLALDYLNSNATASSHRRHEQLREVGDHCLLFSGLFPQQAERRMVKVSYFVDLGRVAYQQIADHAITGMTTIYAELAREFVALMDALQTMRELQGSQSGLTPIHAFDLWNDTGSQHAYRIIRSITGACPVRSTQPRGTNRLKDPKLH